MVKLHRPSEFKVLLLASNKIQVSQMIRVAVLNPVLKDHMFVVKKNKVLKEVEILMKKRRSMKTFLGARNVKYQ